MKKVITVLVVLSGFLAAASLMAQSSSVTEAETGKSFPVSESFGGTEHTLIGVGAREAYGAFNVYAGGFYVQTGPATTSWQRFLGSQAASFVTGGQINWSGLKDSTTLYQWVYSGSFGKALWMKFVRDVTAQQVVDAYKETLRRSIDDYETAATQSPLKDFLDAVNFPVSSGQEMRIWTRGSKVYVKSGDRAVVEIDNATPIIRPIWRIWFGPNPIQVPLRRGLVNNIENLGGPAAE
jgi:hypothetical protein